MIKNDGKRILFLSLITFNSLNKSNNIFADLVREFRDNGHGVTVFMPNEKIKKSEVSECEGITKVDVACGPIQKTSSVKKVLNLKKLDNTAKKLLKKKIKGEFDLVLCMISHCAFYKTVRFVKKRDGAFVYNMVKDIFPQNAVDLGMFKKGGVIYKFFKRGENKYYKISDVLGVLSPKAVDFLKAENPPAKIEINPNSCRPSENYLTEEERAAVRAEYGLPADKNIFVYGGNLGKPQSIDFLIEIIKRNEIEENNAFFVIAGDGTDYARLDAAFKDGNIEKAALLPRMPAEEFEKLCLAADAGLVLLSPVFTIPTYPSRTLSYMQAKLPMIFAIDGVSDCGQIAEDNGYGFTGLSGDIKKFFENLNKLDESKELRKSMGERGNLYMLENYTAKHSYDIIMKHGEGEKNV